MRACERKFLRKIHGTVKATKFVEKIELIKSSNIYEEETSCRLQNSGDWLSWSLQKECLKKECHLKFWMILFANRIRGKQEKIVFFSILRKRVCPIYERKRWKED